MKTMRIIPKLFYFFSILYFLRKIDNKVRTFSQLGMLFFKKGNLVVKIEGRWSFRINDLYDLLALKEVFDEKIYQSLFINIQPHTTLVDIGGYIGDVVVYSTQFPNIEKVITVEPFWENIKRLRDNIKLNRVRNVQILEAAVTDKKGIKHFYIHPNRGQSGFIKYSKNTKRISVKCITLQMIIQMVKTSSIILKCDSEGSEYAMFMKTGEKLIKKIGRIIFEYHNQKTKSKIIKKLHKCGFQIIEKKHAVEPDLGIVYAYQI